MRKLVLILSVLVAGVLGFVLRGESESIISQNSLLSRSSIYHVYPEVIPVGAEIIIGGENLSESTKVIIENPNQEEGYISISRLKSSSPPHYASPSPSWAKTSIIKSKIEPTNFSLIPGLYKIHTEYNYDYAEFTLLPEENSLTKTFNSKLLGIIFDYPHYYSFLEEGIIDYDDLYNPVGKRWFLDYTDYPAAPFYIESNNSNTIGFHQGPSLIQYYGQDLHNACERLSFINKKFDFDILECNLKTNKHGLEYIEYKIGYRICSHYGFNFVPKSYAAAYDSCPNGSLFEGVEFGLIFKSQSSVWPGVRIYIDGKNSAYIKIIELMAQTLRYVSR